MTWASHCYVVASFFRLFASFSQLIVWFGKNIWFSANSYYFWLINCILLLIYRLPPLPPSSRDSIIRWFDCPISPALPSRDLHSIPAGCHFVGFHRFPRISWSSIELHRFQASKVCQHVVACCGLCCRDAALKKNCYMYSIPACCDLMDFKRYPICNEIS